MAFMMWYENLCVTIWYLISLGLNRQQKLIKNDFHWLTRSELRSEKSVKKKQELKKTVGVAKFKRWGTSLPLSSFRGSKENGRVRALVGKWHFCWPNVVLQDVRGHFSSPHCDLPHILFQGVGAISSSSFSEVQSKCIFFLPFSFSFFLGGAGNQTQVFTHLSKLSFLRQDKICHQCRREALFSTSTSLFPTLTISEWPPWLGSVF